MLCYALYGDSPGVIPRNATGGVMDAYGEVLRGRMDGWMDGWLEVVVDLSISARCGWRGVYRDGFCTGEEDDDDDL